MSPSNQSQRDRVRTTAIDAVLDVESPDCSTARPHTATTKPLPTGGDTYRALTLLTRVRPIRTRPALLPATRGATSRRFSTRSTVDPDLVPADYPQLSLSAANLSVGTSTLGINGSDALNQCPPNITQPREPHRCGVVRRAGPQQTDP